MQYQVFVQNSSERHFVASVVNVPDVTGEGQTKKQQLSLGKFVTIEVES